MEAPRCSEISMAEQYPNLNHGQDIRANRTRTVGHEHQGFCLCIRVLRVRIVTSPLLRFLHELSV